GFAHERCRVPADRARHRRTPGYPSPARTADVAQRRARMVGAAGRAGARVGGTRVCQVSGRSPARTADPGSRRAPFRLMTGHGVTRILVTGGSGFIGSRLALLASQQGHALPVVTAVNN